MANDKIRALQVNDTEVVTQVVGNKATRSSVVDDSTLEKDSSTGKIQIKPAGSSKDQGVQRAQMGRGAGFWLVGDFNGGDDTAAGIMQEENTYGADLLVTRVLADVATVSSGACTIDIGVGPSISTSYDNLIDGLDANTGVRVWDNIDDGGTNGQSAYKWPNGEYINGSVATGASAALQGRYAIYAVYIDA